MNKSIYIGQLDNRIEIYKNTRVNSVTGDKTKTPVLLVGAWAKVKDVSGTEEEDGKIIALNVREYIIRYNPVIAQENITELIIQDKQDAYNIYSVAFIGRKEFMTLKCSRRE